MSAPKKPLETTIDSVGTALGFLFDWLGSDERDPDTDPDVLELLQGDADDDDDADVIETDGEGV